MVVVVLKDPEHVQDTINELEIVKSRLVGKAHFDKINIQNWDICRGIGAGDLIWTNVGLFMQSD